MPSHHRGLGDFGSSCGEVVKKPNRDCPNENQHCVATIFQEDLKISPIFDGFFFDSPKIPGSEDHGMLPCTWLYAQEKIDASFNSQTIHEVNLKYNHVFFFKNCCPDSCRLTWTYVQDSYVQIVM